MSDTTIDEIIQIVHGDKCPYAEPCPVKNQAKRTLYDLILKEVVGANRHDIVEVEGTDITDYMNMHRSLQRNKLAEIFGDDNA